MAIARRSVFGEAKDSSIPPSGTVATAAPEIGPITRQRARRSAAGIIGAAANVSSSRVTGTAVRRPRRTASAGVITMAAPKPVVLRVAPHHDDRREQVRVGVGEEIHLRGRSVFHEQAGELRLQGVEDSVRFTATSSWNSAAAVRLKPRGDAMLQVAVQRHALIANSVPAKRIRVWLRSRCEPMYEISSASGEVRKR